MNAVSHICLVDGAVTVIIDEDGKITEDTEIPMPQSSYKVTDIAPGTRWRCDRYDLR